MLIGYIRVSKSDGSQVLDLQRDALQGAGVSPDRVYQDLASGRKDDRPGLVACLKALQPGNTLVVWKLDRLGRLLGFLCELVEQLGKQGAGFQSLTDGIDTTTHSGKLVFHIIGAEAGLLLKQPFQDINGIPQRSGHGNAMEAGILIRDEVVVGKPAMRPIVLAIGTSIEGAHGRDKP